MEGLDRRKLRKLLGKRAEYTAIYMRTSKQGHNLLEDLYYKSKLVCDHAWVYIPNLKLVKGDAITITAVATTYKDQHGERKFGLDDVRLKTPDLYDIKKVIHDNHFKNKRKKR